MFSSKCRGLTQGVSRRPGLRGLHLTQEVITDQLAVSRGHLTPELSLRLLTSECPGYSAPASAHPLASDHDSDPWWAIYWPGGQVLARTILRSLRSAALLIGTIGVSLLLTLIAFFASLFETWLHSPWHAADWIDTLAGSIAPELLPLAILALSNQGADDGASALSANGADGTDDADDGGGMLLPIIFAAAGVCGLRGLRCPHHRSL